MTAGKSTETTPPRSSSKTKRSSLLEWQLSQNTSTVKDSSSACIATQEAKPVREDQEAMALKKLMRKPMQNGSSSYFNFRVDYLKYDNCHAPNVTAKMRYYLMGKALNETGRPIFYSICNWGQEKVWEWGASIGNSWRTTGDITNHWTSFLKNLDLQVGLEKYAEIGGWNDPDMLEVGNGKLTYSESLAHFSLWCLLKAPLLIGCDVNKISKESLEILSNEELIAINQDPLGV